MASAGDRCAKTVKSDDDFIGCSGFCNNVVHMKCAKLNKPFLKVNDENPNLLWICDECCKLIKLARFRETVSSIGCAVSAIAEKTESICAELKAEITKNSQQISRLSRIVSTSSSVPANPVSRPAAKRRREEVFETSSSLMGGRKPAENCNIATVPLAFILAWIYISRFHPSVSKEMVEKLTKAGLNCNDEISVIPLVKKGMDVNTLNFVSFKVGIPAKYRDVALNRDKWPQGVLFRESEDNRRQDVWCPPIDVSPLTPDKNDRSTPVSMEQQGTPGSPFSLLTTPMTL
ncbi:uncharacterized protein LOC131434105 [Malaya genurostris]|uniref:uncharacterized protein LOC131434105 n=1 Tax=Malaya genurostris TaxID=325434 RepID=UPI0026F389BD|nr:uncharacterized protein LOC131434105 [Malaya genurostris]